MDLARRNLLAAAKDIINDNDVVVFGVWKLSIVETKEFTGKFLKVVNYQNDLIELEDMASELKQGLILLDDKYAVGVDMKFRGVKCCYVLGKAYFDKEDFY